ncbi:nuclease-related domain-containing protein [Streptomyces monomycini]|uniref:nuclease-related domain-containing protein n=1 Tax=Streptomyces monomycini TaxID=371720 RepID=UPI001EEA3910|nr:nuclease-related domain-containing protein [Streptomyces monomycini]
MNAGASAAAKAAAIRAAGRGRWWQRVLHALGFRTQAAARAASAAARWEAGAEGERRTGRLLAPLTYDGWWCFADRAIPGAGQANADHVLVGPCGCVCLVDSKLWHRRASVYAAGGRLMHGSEDRDRHVDRARFEGRCIGKALKRPVAVLITVHNAPVADGEFTLRGVLVLSAEHLVEALRRTCGQPDPARARRVAAAVDALLPPYVSFDFRARKCR